MIKTSEALAYAQERDLDLVEVAPEARPPVCRVLDYSKYKYEQAQKQKAARKHQQQITIREIKFRPKIAQNDYDTKKGHVTRFLKNKDKVKITIMFRGREVTHPERGTALLDRLSSELSEIAVIEQTPLQDGRNMTMMLAPSKSILAGEKEKAADDEPSPGGGFGRSGFGRSGLGRSDFGRSGRNRRGRDRRGPDRRSRNRRGPDRRARNRRGPDRRAPATGAASASNGNGTGQAAPEEQPQSPAPSDAGA